MFSSGRSRQKLATVISMKDSVVIKITAVHLIHSGTEFSHQPPCLNQCKSLSYETVGIIYNPSIHNLHIFQNCTTIYKKVRRYANILFKTGVSQSLVVVLLLVFFYYKWLSIGFPKVGTDCSAVDCACLNTIDC